MKISYFKSVRQPKQGEVLTAAKFQELSDQPFMVEVIKNIRGALATMTDENADKVKEYIAKEKVRLPVICWQSSFKENYRKDANAIPSGLFMVDIDHTTKETMAAMIVKAKALAEELKVVYIGETPKYGVRIVAECYPQCANIAECQKLVFDKLEIAEEHRDTCCVDWARCSFMVPTQLIHYLDGTIFEREAAVVYENTLEPNAKHQKSEQHRNDGNAAQTSGMVSSVDNGQTAYKDLMLQDIAVEWLRSNGGEPVEGNRNTQLFKLCVRMRYICDFNELTLFNNIPSYGLDDAEMHDLIRKACQFVRSQDMPADLTAVIDRLLKQQALGEDRFDEMDFVDINDTSKVPSLPPVLKEWYEVAPQDFKMASVVIQLPILGALGSKLRAEYLDGSLHSPTFQVSLEAPQASGKSFMRRIINRNLALMKEHDAVERDKEREYKDKVAQLKLTNTKVTKKDKEELLGEKPSPLIRYCPATMSITQLLIRMNNAKGLHLFAMAEEIDTVYKAFKRGFSSFSDALRCSFDNSEYGQDYASENSFSGIVKLYYNVLYSGTPKAMRRFYPDVEDGLVSRVFFCTLPDQFGKPHPRWGEFTRQQEHQLELGLTRLNEITLQDEEVQPDHVMEMKWLAQNLEEWILAQQKLAVTTEDRSRDIFCRRAAVVGFRAGMLAWFLWGESQQKKTSVINFSRWIANLMLKQHLSRFNIESEVKNTIPYADLYKKLGDEFTREQLLNEACELGIKSRPRMILYRWVSAGMIGKITKMVDEKVVVNFKKIQG